MKKRGSTKNGGREGKEDTQKERREEAKKEIKR